ncbi:MAG TPA: heavy metal-associated domain-containing protein [Candidatus Thermoplasmatota archaeon]|nr:heavy metal-associated domain-containing protein [Candidatus Thermoplasmatota archaeon]
MKRLTLRVDTLACEADETTVLDDLLAHDGVIAAEIDLTREMLSLAYDEHKTTKTSLMDHLRFFGIVAHHAALTPA